MFTGHDQTLVDQSLVNDGFFPDLNLSEFLSVYRIPAEYKSELILDHLTMAVFSVNDELQDVKTHHISSGSDTLESVAGDSVGAAGQTKSYFIEQYKRAVYCLAKADLFDQFVTFNRKDQAESQANESDKINNIWRAKSRQAIKGILGLTANVSVELL